LLDSLLQEIFQNMTSNSPTLARVLHMRDRSPEEKMLEVSNVKERIVVSREEGELSDHDDNYSKEESYCRTVTRPVVLHDDSTRFDSVENRRNPWGGIAENWKYELGRNESNTDLNENYMDEIFEKRRVSVKDRLGWKRKIEPGMSGARERDEEVNIHWNEKMKRPRMEMVADLEERKIFGRVQRTCLSHNQRFNAPPVSKKDGPKNKSAQADDGLTIGAVKRHDEMKDFKLSKRFLGMTETRRPRFRGEIQRSVDFRKSGVQDSEGWRSVVGRSQATVSLRKEKEREDLEFDNGSDLDDDASVLVQVIQSDVSENSGGESERIRKAVAKMEDAKQKEEIRRIEMKLVQKEELAKAKRKNKQEEKLNSKKIGGKEKEVEKKLREQLAFMKKVEERMKALEAASTNKKLLKSRHRKRRSRSEIDLKNNSRLGKKHARSQRKKEETESSSSSSSSNTTSSSSASDSSDSDSSSSEASSPRRGKRSSFRYLKQEVKKDSRKKNVCATSTPKREIPVVKKSRPGNEENNEKVTDLKLKLKDYLKKVKAKK